MGVDHLINLSLHQLPNKAAKHLSGKTASEADQTFGATSCWPVPVTTCLLTMQLELRSTHTHCQRERLSASKHRKIIVLGFSLHGHVGVAPPWLNVRKTPMTCHNPTNSTTFSEATLSPAARDIMLEWGSGYRRRVWSADVWDSLLTAPSDGIFIDPAQALQNKRFYLPGFSTSFHCCVPDLQHASIARFLLEAVLRVSCPSRMSRTSRSTCAPSKQPSKEQAGACISIGVILQIRGLRICGQVLQV